jgi:hypothetical protein
MTLRSSLAIAVAASLAAASAGYARADSVADFYAGKAIQMNRLRRGLR